MKNLNLTEALICIALTLFAAYLTCHVVFSPLPLWVKWPVAVILLIVLLWTLNKVFIELCITPNISQYIQMAATWLRLITIISAYEVTGRVTINQGYALTKSRVYFFWIPRHVILADKTTMICHSVHYGVDIQVFQERYIGQNAK